MTTGADGNVIGQQGHFPFGESWYAANTTTKYQFTSYERDAESGNDYAQARYHINRLGRFASPDPLAGDTQDPQSLNRYIYVYDDPGNAIDPSGLCPVLVAGFNDTPENSPQILAYAKQIGADVVFPYAGHSTAGDLGSLLAQDMGAVNEAVRTTEAGLLDAASIAQNQGNSTGNAVNEITFSGGAQASNSALGALDASGNGIDLTSAVYLEPGTGLITGRLSSGLRPGNSPTANSIVRGKGFLNAFLNAVTGAHGIPVSHTDCRHSADCVFRELINGTGPVAPQNNDPCNIPQIFAAGRAPTSLFGGGDGGGVVEGPVVTVTVILGSFGGGYSVESGWEPAWIISYTMGVRHLFGPRGSTF